MGGLIGVQATHTLKQLQTRRAQIQAELADQERVLADAQSAVAGTRERLKAVERDIEALEAASAEPIVTEHAMLRYLQHVKGLDLEALQREMLSGNTVEQINLVQSGRLPTPSGATLVVKQRTVVTVIPPTSMTNPKKLAAKQRHKGKPKPAEQRQLAQEEE